MLDKHSSKYLQFEQNNEMYTGLEQLEGEEMTLFLTELGYPL